MSGVVYFVERESDGAVKIGVTKNLYTRLGELRRQHGRIKLLGIIKGGLVREKILHWVFEGARLDGEFFAPDDELLGLIGKYAAVPEKKKGMAAADDSPTGKYRCYYKVGIKPETQPRLVEMARDLGFFVTAPGRFYGDPSPADMLDKLAEICQKNPALIEGLRRLGVVGDGPPPAEA